MRVKGTAIQQTLLGAALLLALLWNLARAAEISHEILDELGAIATIDLSAIERIDTVGAWIVTRTVNEHGAKVIGASPEAERLLEALREDKSEYAVHRDRRSPTAT